MLQSLLRYEAPDDGICVIAPSIKVAPGAPTSGPTMIAHASAKNISDAARAIIVQCVIPRRIGGIAKFIGEVAFLGRSGVSCHDIALDLLNGTEALEINVHSGGDNKLPVIVAAQTAPVSCGNDISATPESCRYILDEMEKTIATERFGHFQSGQQSLTVATPITRRSRKMLPLLNTQSPADGAFPLPSRWEMPNHYR